MGYFFKRLVFAAAFFVSFQAFSLCLAMQENNQYVLTPMSTSRKIAKELKQFLKKKNRADEPKSVSVQSLRDALFAYFHGTEIYKDDMPILYEKFMQLVAQWQVPEKDIILTLMPKNRLIPKTNTASVSAKSAIMFNGVIFALGGKIIVSVGPELIGLLADEEIISVLSHEMAHYKKNHWMIDDILHLFSLSGITFLVYNSDILMDGLMQGEVSALFCIFGIELVVPLLINRIMPLLPWLSRMMEREADILGALINNDATEAASAKIKLFLENRFCMDQLKPTIEENLIFIEHLAKANKPSICRRVASMYDEHPCHYSRIHTLLDLQEQLATDAKTEKIRMYEKYAMIPKIQEWMLKANEYMQPGMANLKVVSIMIAFIFLGWSVKLFSF